MPNGDELKVVSTQPLPDLTIKSSASIPSNKGWFDNLLSKIGPPEESNDIKKFFLGLPLEGASMASGAEAVSAAKEAIPSAERAGASFKQLSEQIGTHPVAVTDDMSTALNELRKASTTTNTGIPPVVRKLMDRVDSFGGMGSLTYDEARSFTSELGNMAAGDKMAMTDNTKRLVGNLYGALKESTGSTAELAGKGAQLQGAIDEYRQAMKIKGVTGAAKDFAVNQAWKWLIGGLLGGTAAAGAKKLYEAGTP